MFPRFPSDDGADTSSAYSEFRRQHALRDAASSIPFPDVSDVLLPEMGAMESFSRSETSFSLAISNIVRLRSQEEMCRIDAGMIVTAMQYTQAVGNVSIGQPPRDAVTVLDVLSSSGHAECPVSLSRGSSPEPAWPEIATVRWDRPVLVDLLPESFFDRTRWRTRTSRFSLCPCSSLDRGVSRQEVGPSLGVAHDIHFRTDVTRKEV